MINPDDSDLAGYGYEDMDDFHYDSPTVGGPGFDDAGYGS